MEPSVTNQSSATDQAEDTAEFLCTDLDGTILIGDSFWESFLCLLEGKFWYILLIPFWFLRGKAALKHEIARRVLPNVSTLPVRTDLIEYLHQQQAGGKTLILATGADGKIASAVANHLGLFDAVLASDGTTNLTGERKKEAVQLFTQGGRFDYIGNSWNDIPTWQVARAAILVEPSRRLLRIVRKIVPRSTVF